MADTTYAGESTTFMHTLGMRMAAAVKRGFAAVIEAREREARRRIEAFPPEFLNGGTNGTDRL